MKRNEKFNLHLATNDDGLYFWNRLDFHKLRKMILVFAIMMAVLPLFVSLTVRPWIALIHSVESAKNCFYLVVGEYWYSLVYLMGALMTLCMVIGILQMCNRRAFSGFSFREWILSHWLSLSMLALLIWSIISTFLAKDQESAIWGDWYCHEGLVLYFFYGAFFLCGSWLTGKQMKLLAEVMAAVCTVTGILTITQGRFFPWLFYLENHQSAMFHQYNHYGYYLSICIPLVMGLALQDTSKNVFLRLLRLMELWLIFNAMAVNSVRGSFLAVVVVVICFNLYVFILKRELIGRMLFLDALFFGTIFLLNTGSDLGSRLAGLAGGLAEVSGASGEDKQAAIDSLGSSRGMLWRYGLQFMMEKPVFGFGPGNLMEPYTLVESHTSSPHNDLILIGASMGIPAVIFYVSGLAGHLAGYLRHIRQMSVFEVTMFAAMGGYLLGSFVGVSIYYTSSYYFLLLGCTYGIYRSKFRESRKTEKTSEDVQKV